MANWYENPEIHAEDYDELMAMLNEYEQGDPDNEIVW